MSSLNWIVSLHKPSQSEYDGGRGVGTIGFHGWIWLVALIEIDEDDEAISWILVKLIEEDLMLSMLDDVTWTLNFWSCRAGEIEELWFFSFSRFFPQIFSIFFSDLKEGIGSIFFSLKIKLKIRMSEWKRGKMVGMESLATIPIWRNTQAK